MYSSFQACKKQLSDVLPIDFFLAKKICQEINPDASLDLLFHSVMAVSRALRDGHSCLKLAEEAEKQYWTNSDDDKMGFQFPSLFEWHQYLFDSAIAPENNHPLVYENKRLYLRRYWQFEDELGKSIRHFIQQSCDLNLDHGRKVINQLFPIERNKSNELDWQKIAVANALGQQFSIIAGGPGTGKTFTVTKILAALQALSNNSLRIAMVAPTGKAAQRLNESIQKAKSVLKINKLSSEETLNSIPDSASTLHRLLKVKMGSHNFHYHANNLLPFDVILVDEISMIDLPLMARLMRACSSSCRIIMLGDADQLPSVAAGSVLADLAPRQTQHYSSKNSQHLSQLTGFNIPSISDKKNLTLDYLTVLQHSHRFDSGGEISQLAKEVINGKVKQSWDLLKQGKTQIECIQSSTMRDWIIQMVEQYYVPMFRLDASNSIPVTEAFKKLEQFRFLAATRQGEQGVTQINALIEQYLQSKGLVKNQSEFYQGRPIMVTENHYHVGLYNGDIGILWENENGKLAAAFPQNNDTSPVRWLSLGRLPVVETVYAMTIHKTQGSEFNHVALILPEYDSLILSRELLYTGITRASKKISIWSNYSTWETTVKRKVQRYSGLADRVYIND